MARPRLGDSETKRLQMVITEDELRAIEDWQFENRIASKSEAIRRLVQIGLRVDRELELIFRPLVAATDAAWQMDGDWNEVFEDPIADRDLAYYAMRTATALGDGFPQMLEQIVDANNRLIDLSVELTELQGDDLTAAIKKADAARKDAADANEAWQREAKQKGLLKRLHATIIEKAADDKEDQK